MKPYHPPSNLKFLYAYSLPPLFVLITVIGADGWGGYVPIASAMTIVGAVGFASASAWSGKRYIAGIVYLVAVELLLILLH